MVDLPRLAATFGRRLHEAGLPTTPDRAARFAEALALAPPATRDRLYWTARVTFLSSVEQLALFDGVFASVFDGLVDVAESRGQARPPRTRADRRPAPFPFPRQTRSGADWEDEAAEVDVPLPAASREERLAHRDFAELDPDEVVALRALMRRLAFAPPPRRSRRYRRDRRGERLDVRATIRAARRTGGDPLRLARRSRVLAPRRLVILCDISGSMEAYSRVFVQFLQGAVGGARAEAFVFATRLTRLTRALAGRRSQLAIDRAAAAAPDWAGGTRIGEALKRFNDRYGRRGMARGAVVVIVSDGWERDDPALVGREMARLRRLAYRIVWVNPRAASPSFEPLAGGMAAALPYCDAVVSGHSLAALEAVAEAITRGAG